MFSVQFAVYLNFTQFEFHLILFNLKIGFHTLQKHQTIPTNATVSTDSDIVNALWLMRKIEF